MPVLYDINILSNDYKEQLKEQLRMVVNRYNADGGRVSAITKMISFYSGRAYNTEKVKSMIQLATKDSTARFTRYNLGRSKLRVLPNEFLGTPLQFSIFSLDRESNLNRMDRFKTQQALAAAKPAIEEVRNEGYSVYDGLQLPDEDEVEQNGPMSIRLEHEINMQRYIEEKKLDKGIKEKLMKQVIYNICSNECFGKVETDYDGKLTLRSISPTRLLTMDNDDSDWSDNAPYIGEYRPMDITTAKRLFSFSKEINEKIKELVDNNQIAWSGGSNPREGVIDTYTIQFRNRGRKIYFKTKNVNGKILTFEISQEYYDKNRKKIEREVAQGKYQIDCRVLEKIHEVTWIGSAIDEVVNIHVANCATMLDSDGHIYPAYDYVRLKSNTIGSEVSEPIASLVKQLDEDYDVIRSLINRELKKPQGNVMTYDRAFLPSTVKNYDELRAKMVETGEIIYDSSADGNVSQTQGNGTGISSIKVGDINVILQMANIAMSIEQTVERITGINESRSGLTKATATATTSNNNLEASRTMTYDIFWNVQRFGEKVMTVMCNKLKSNPVEVNPQYSYSLMDEEQYDRFISTADIMLSDFKAFINDGRKDAAIIDYIKQAIFPQDVAAGKLTSTTISEFLSKDTLPEAIEVLRKAEELFNKMAQQNQQSVSEGEQAAEQAKVQGAVELEKVRGENAIALSDRDRDNKIAVNEHVEGIRSATKQTIESQRTAAQERIAEGQAQHRHADVDKTNNAALQKSFIDGEQKKELEDMKPKPAAAAKPKK